MNHTGTEQVITLDRRYRLGRFTRSLVRRWIDWAVHYLPDPLPGLLDAAEGMPGAARGILLAEAEKLAARRRSLQDKSLATLWDAQPGRQTRFALLLDRYHWQLDPLPIYSAAVQVYDVPALLRNAEGRIALSEMDVERQFYRELGLLPTREDKAEMDWAKLDADLFRNSQLLPHQVDDMTLPEIACIAKGEASDGLDIALCYGKLSPKQKTELALRQVMSRLT